MDALIAVVVGQDSAASIRQEVEGLPSPCVPVVALMLQSAGSSSHTLVRLSEAPGLHTRDCYSIARSIVEVAANVCYVISQGPEVAERAMRHARQKAFRDMDRESKIGNTLIRVALSGRPEAKEIEGLQDDLAEFTSHSGREKGWVDTTIDDRIAAVGKVSDRAMTALHWARFAVYRHSSEVLHGSLFGALFFFGLTAPGGGPRSKDGLRAALGQQHMLILMAAILSLSAVVQVFHGAYGFRAAQQQSDDLMKQLRSIPYLRADGDA